MMLSCLSKCFPVYRKTLLPTNKFDFQVKGDPYDQINLPYIMEDCSEWM